jgi:hypothetical protein
MNIRGGVGWWGVGGRSKANKKEAKMEKQWAVYL